MAGRHPYADNGYNNGRGYAYDDDDDDIYQHGHGGRNVHNGSISSYGRRYDHNNTYGDTHYDPSATPPWRGGGGRGGPRGRGVYMPPSAASINNRGGGGSSQYPVRRGGPPGATRYPNPSTAYDSYSYSPSPSPPPPSSRQSQGFGGVAGQLLTAAGQLSPPKKRVSGKNSRGAVLNDAPIGPPVIGGGEKYARLKSNSGGRGGGGGSATARFGLYAPSGGGSGEIARPTPSRGNLGRDHSNGREAHLRDPGRSESGGTGDMVRGSSQQQQQQHKPSPSAQAQPQPPAPATKAAAAAAAASATAVPTAGETHHSHSRNVATSGGEGAGTKSRSGSSSPRATAAAADPPPPKEVQPVAMIAAARTMSSTTAAAAAAAAAAWSAEASALASAKGPVSAPEATVTPPAAPPLLSWVTIERAGKRRLGGLADKRRLKLMAEGEPISPFQGCPIPDCPMRGAKGIGVRWMARHLESHTKVAMEKPQKELYIKSTVAEVLHEMCLDSEVPRYQRKFERKRMSRALLNPPPVGIGLLAGIMETVATGDNKDPRVRRCAMDLAVGGCEGITRDGTIVRCDKCHAWYHVSCGQMVRGDGISSDESRDETLCRSCARLTVGAPQGKDPSPAVHKQLMMVRDRRMMMLEFLEGDVESGSPRGVFNIKLNIRGEDTAGASRGVNPKYGVADGPAAGANSRVDSENGGSVEEPVSRGPCAATACMREARSDSRYCSDRCGVLNAEAMLADAVRHQVEENIGIDRGRRLRETRELKARKQQIGIAMKKVEFPRVPGFQTDREITLQSLVLRRCRLWQRLIEIGAYWEKVSGSRDLLTTGLSSTQTSKEQTTAASAAAAAADDDTAPGGRAVHHGLRGRDGVRVGSTAGGSSGGVQARQDEGASRTAAAKGTVAETKGPRAEGAGAVGKTGAVLASAQNAVGTGGEVIDVEAAQTPLTSNGRMGNNGSGTATGKRAREESSGPPEKATKSLKQSFDGEAGIGGGCGGATQTARPMAGEGGNPTRSGDVGDAVPQAASVAAGGESEGNGEASTEPPAAGPPTAMEVVEQATAQPEVEVGTGLEGPKLVSTVFEQMWTYDIDGKEQVLWYCPPGGGVADRCRNREQLKEHWRKQQGNGQVPRQFTFRVVDAPLHWKRVESHALDVGPKVAEERIPAAADYTALRLRQTTGGVHNFTCFYCGDETGPRVNAHLEQCYRKTTAARNKRLDRATLRPLPDKHFLRGGSRIGALSVTEPMSVPPSAALDSPAAIGRQLLSRRVSYARFDSLPDPSRFQLHHDLKGWSESPSRLDFLYKELVRQRNAAIYELQALDKEEAELELHLRHDWMKDDLRSIPRARVAY